MTAEQIEICKALGNVRYAPATWDKRFGQNIAGLASTDPHKELTETQREWIFRLLYKYRKQLPRLYNIHKGHPHCSQKKKRSLND